MPTIISIAVFLCLLMAGLIRKPAGSHMQARWHPYAGRRGGTWKPA